MNTVVVNCVDCGRAAGAVIPAGRCTGFVPCVACLCSIDVGHAYLHAPWCLSCGDDINYCDCSALRDSSKWLIYLAFDLDN